MLLAVFVECVLLHSWESLKHLDNCFNGRIQTHTPLKQMKMLKKLRKMYFSFLKSRGMREELGKYVFRLSTPPPKRSALKMFP